MNIAMVARKGGAGKTTLSAALFESLRQAGKVVGAVDWDPQGTLTKFRKCTGTIEEAIDPDFVIYDTPPDLSHPATSAALLAADVVLVITSPSPADMWECSEAVRRAKDLAPNARLRLLVNKARKNTTLTNLVSDSAKGIEAELLDSMLSQRECYQHMLVHGWKALDAAAQKEVLQLTLNVLALVASSNPRRGA